MMSGKIANEQIARQEQDDKQIIGPAPPIRPWRRSNPRSPGVEEIVRRIHDDPAVAAEIARRIAEED